MILTLAATKGGTGKTTLAIELSLLAASHGVSVVLLDGDPQKSATSWSQAVHPPVPVRPLPSSAREVAALQSDYDFVVIDTAGAVIPSVTLAIAAADAVLIPCGPSPLDLWASRALIAAVADTPMAIVISRAQPGTALSRQARAAVETLGVDVAEARIAQRTDHVAALLDGRLPHGEAGEELRELYAELADAGWTPDLRATTTTKD